MNINVKFITSFTPHRTNKFIWLTFLKFKLYQLNISGLKCIKSKYEVTNLILFGQSRCYCSISKKLWHFVLILFFVLKTTAVTLFTKYKFVGKTLNKRLFFYSCKEHVIIRLIKSAWLTYNLIKLKILNLFLHLTLI